MTELAETPITRRKTLQLLLGFSIVSTLGGIVLPILAYLTPRRTGVGYNGPVQVGKVEDFALGTGTVINVNDKPVIVVNTRSGGIKAFSAICTHLGCIVAWDGRKNVIHCPCHEGLFNATTGAVVSGPPPKALAAYELAVQDGKVMIGRPTGELFGG